MSSPYAKSHRPRLSVGNKISIIVSTRDRSPLLRSTLRCARAQTWSDKEVIVVDEGSSDDTQSVLATEFPEVKVVRHDVARGPAAARNAGVAAAGGDWLFFWDDDDLMHPRHLEELMGAALEAPPRCLVTGRQRDFAIVSGAVMLAPVFCAPAKRSDTETLTELLEPTRQRTITHSSILWPRELFDTLSWDEELAFNDDFDLFGRSILAGWHIVGREVGQYFIRLHTGPRVTTGVSTRRLLSPPRYYLKWSELLKQHPEHAACASALRNGLMEQLIDMTDVAAAKNLMPQLEAAFRDWGGRRFYPTHPPQNWLKRAVVRSILEVGGLSAMRRFLELVARVRSPRSDYISSFQPPATDADREHASIVRMYQ